MGLQAHSECTHLVDKGLRSGAISHDYNNLHITIYGGIISRQL